MKEKILMMSDSPFLATGFRNQSVLLCNSLVDAGFDVTYLGCQYQGQKLKNATLADGRELKFKIIGGNPYNAYVGPPLQEILYKEKPDIFGILLDTFMVYPWILNINLPKSFFWFPSDGGFFPQDCENVLRKVSHPVAMAKFGQAQLKDYYKIDTDYIPHGVDISRFRPVNEIQKIQLRIKYSQKFNIDLNNKFIVLCVGRNQGRKNMERVIRSFAVWNNKNPHNDVILMMHMDPNDPASIQNLPYLAQRFKVENKIIWTGMKAYNAFNDYEMPELYQVSDLQISTTCIHPETDILTKKGIKKIKDIKIGDKVISESGKFRKVLNVIPTKNYNGKMLKIKADGFPELKVTPNHRIYRVKCKGLNDKRKIIKERKIELEEASTLKKYDYLIYPIPKTSEKIKEIATKKYIIKCKHSRGLPQKVNLDYEFGLLCGFYLSEGCSTKDGLAFCFHTKEDYYYKKIDQILNKKFSLKTRIIHNTRNRTTLWTTNSMLGRMFKDLFGAGSHNKKLPEWILDSPKEFRKGLIEGIWKGDGCLWISRKSSKVFELQMVAKQLMNQLFNLLIAEGFKPTLSSIQRLSEVWRIKITGNQNFGKFCDIKEELNQRDKTRIFSDGKNVYYPISKIEEENYKGTVYDLTVDKEHNFCCPCLVKNSGEGFGICTIESMACGVPVLITDYTTGKELVTDNEAGLGIKLLGEKENYVYPYPAEQLIEGVVVGSWNVDRGFSSLYDAAEKLEYLYTHKEERIKMGINARKAAVKDYDWNNVVSKKWIEKIRRMLQ